MKNRYATYALTGGLILAAMPLFAPGPKSIFNLSEFASLPVLEGGRVKPIDSFARNALLMLRSKQSVLVDGKRLSPTQWLLDAAFKPTAADMYPTFVVDDPEVLGLVGLEQKGRYYSYAQLAGKREAISQQAQDAEKLESPQRSRFQSAVLNLENRLNLYERIKNSFMVSGHQDPAQELAVFRALVPAAMRTIHATKRSNNDMRVLKTLSELLERYSFIASAAAFKPLAPSAAENADAWTSIGEAAVKNNVTNHHPGLAMFVRLGSAYQKDDANAFSAALREYRHWLERERPTLARRARAEVVFNKAAPFISGMVLYVGALLLIFVSWAVKRKPILELAHGLAWAAFAVHSLGLIARIVLQGRPPVTNLYSSAVFVGWAGALLGLFAERLHRRGFASAAACALGFTTLLVAHHLTSSGDTMEMMRAVLDSNFWLATHVITVTIGYSSTFLAGALAIAWVVRRHTVLRPDPDANKALVALVYGVVCFSLFFSFVGTMLGGIWADQSWGRFWGWDPKENGALLIVLWNALILHARWGGYARERGIMVMAIFGNAITSLSWFGVNMLGIGLHSYGFMDQAFWWLAAFVSLQLLLMLLGWLPPRFWKHRELSA